MATPGGNIAGLHPGWVKGKVLMTTTQRTDELGHLTEKRIRVRGRGLNTNFTGSHPIYFPVFRLHSHAEKIDHIFSRRILTYDSQGRPVSTLVSNRQVAILKRAGENHPRFTMIHTLAHHLPDTQNSKIFHFSGRTHITTPSVLLDAYLIAYRSQLAPVPTLLSSVYNFMSPPRHTLPLLNQFRRVELGLSLWTLKILGNLLWSAPKESSQMSFLYVNPPGPSPRHLWPSLTPPFLMQSFRGGPTPFIRLPTLQINAEKERTSGEPDA